jgi:hypothetical protein
MSRVVSAAAHEHLRPLGLRRRGRSRSWFDDQGWWLINVEFQPSLSDGTYLNIGAMWLWDARDYWSFDDGYRVSWREDGKFATQPATGERGWTDFLALVTSEQFTRDVNLVADVARRRVEQLRATYPDPATTADRLGSRTIRPGDRALWHHYHTGAAAALSGDVVAARQAFAGIVARDRDPHWARDLARQAEQLAGLADHPAALRHRITALIDETRHRLNLPSPAPADLETSLPT